jgi:hypothetical protein
MAARLVREDRRVPALAGIASLIRVRPGELAAEHPVPLVLGGEPLPAHPDVLCSSCNASKTLSQLRR